MGQRGQALIEAIVSTAIAIVLLGAVLSAAIATGSHFGPNPARSALDLALRREMSVARDVLKYQGVALQPAAIQTTIPLPDGSPLPATLQLQTEPLAGGGVHLTIAGAVHWRGTDATLSLSSDVAAPQPLPQSTIVLPELAPAPTGAP